VQGSFRRGDQARGQGALALGDDDPVQVQLPTAVISVVCRSTSVTGSVRIERRLEGTSSVEFATIELQKGERCAQVRDIIPPGTLGPGSFRYVVRLMTDSVEIASGIRKFDAVAGP
jgi:hypothetical protein